ncbi:hypothetical protein [Nesterenkonia sp. NBAIMH1]|uniref:hypothetical protein n=1 Tax=Nesterenkonia sp. NBAIMH1 TaxID=2600320 RepID=UPI0011B42398|nr:hypothetical protein [Nesterenkonia sp. NBAIMH1]
MVEKQGDQRDRAARRRNGLRRAVLSSAAAVTITAVSAGAAAPAMAHGPKWLEGGKQVSAEASIEIVNNEIVTGSHWDSKRLIGSIFHLDGKGLSKQTKATLTNRGALFDIEVGAKGYRTVTVNAEAQLGLKFRSGHCTDKKTNLSHAIRLWG